VRNYLYDSGFLKQAEFLPAIISVGNLRVGGTGKTPHVEYLISLLKSDYKVAILSRGYGRKSKGFILGNDRSTASLIGDEPMQIYSRYGKEVTVAVGEERSLAIAELMAENAELNVILLDDAFQHRAVSRDINILLTEYSRPFFKDFILPSGRLRESRRGAERADIIIVTKCPDTLKQSEKEKFRREIEKYAPASSGIFFTSLKYHQPVPLSNKIFNGNEKVILFSGIANTDKLEEEVSSRYLLEKHIRFSDHHNYSVKDINKIIQQFNAADGNDKCILTTEKDMVKLLEPEIKKLLADLPVFYLPVEVYFLEGKENFEQLVLKIIKSKLEKSGEAE
jgi:tetraacyldisaccharide 4'-kinase